MRTNVVLTGTCLCGDIAFEVSGPIEMMGHCHSSMCRKFHGSAFATFGTTAREDFRWVRGAERVRTYQSSAQGNRHFCPRCGSAVPMSEEGQPFVLLPMGNVTGDPGTRPRLHCSTGSMAPWHTIVDDLPQHEACPTEFGQDAISLVRPVREPKSPGAIGGSCLCGAVAFEFDGPPLRMYNCHCSRCQQAAGSAYQTLLRVRRSGYRWLAGSDNIVNYQLPGTRFECAFCRTCGSRTPWERGGELCVPAGSLDSDPSVKPTANIFTDSRAAWTVVDQSLETWPEASS